MKHKYDLSNLKVDDLDQNQPLGRFLILLFREFESEVISVDNEFGAGKVDAVHPSISIVAENPVAVVERTVAKKGTAALAKAYLDYLYSDEAQEIAAKHALRPRNPAILKKYASTFRPIQLFTVNEVFGSFADAQKVHFNDGGQFDKIYTVK